MLNPLAEKILKSKYLQEKDTCANDIFTRVAKVAAIVDVIEAHLVPPSLFEEYQELAQRVYDRRKLKAKKNKNIKDFKGIWEKEAKKYYNLISSLDFMAASPILLNAGKLDKKGMLASCFFLRVQDSMEAILDRAKDVGLISKLGGGVGLDVSDLRPKGSTVKGTNGKSSGPVSFLKVYNEIGNQVEQGGLRRAAMLACMCCDHPDILDFIMAKKEEGVFKNFNFSVLLSDRFMTQLKDSPSSIWICNFEGTGYIISKNREIVPTSDYKSTENYYSIQDIWNLIIEHAHANGEPGILFDDTIQRADPFKGKYGKLCVNPCSELTLLDGESCILGSINLSNMVEEKENPRCHIEYDKLDKTIELGVRFLDNMVDLNYYPLKSIEETTLKFRKLGLGTMGLHDLLLKLGYAYGEESSDFINGLYAYIQDKARKASEELGKARGIPASLKQASIDRRNSAITTIPPTGTTSIICGCSSGIEPVFRWAHERNDSYGTHEVKHFMLERFKVLPDYAKTADEISAKDHLSVLAAAQRHTDSSISKTVNLPNSATVEDVSNTYKEAYYYGCKCVTVYRSGSRKEEVLKSKEVITEEVKEYATENSNTEHDQPLTEITIRKRPPILFGATYELNTPGGKAFITINEDNKGIRECFITVSKAGSEIASHVAAIGRLISNSLQYNVPIETLIEHLKGQKSTPVWVNGQLICSVEDAIGKALEDYKWRYVGFSELIEKEARPLGKPGEEKNAEKESGDTCPECGNNLRQESGCSTCYECGFSKCGG